MTVEQGSPTLSQPSEWSKIGLSPPRIALLWLVLVFTLGLVMRFLPRDQPPPSLEEAMRLPERLALLARFGEGIPPQAREQMLQAAKLAEADESERLQVLEDKLLSPESVQKLPEGYRRMAEFRRAPTAEGERALRQMAGDARRRLSLCLALLSAFVLSALALSLFAKTERVAAPVSMAALAPAGILALFMVWDIGNIFGLGLLVDGMSLRKVLPPLALILLVQVAGYGLLLFLLKLARRTGGPWNLTYPFPAAWIGRGYFACYALVLSLNLLIGAVTGQTPTSSNPLLGIFLEAAYWQVWVLALLVVVVGPAFEELIFRGWLLGGLREHWGDTRAILVSSALFALIHGDLWATPALFLLGCVFGWVYLRSGSLYASIVLHAMWNATTFTFLLANMP
jgi:membrane protease YdiL (CAAX protease family)